MSDPPDGPAASADNGQLALPRRVGIPVRCRLASYSSYAGLVYPGQISGKLSLTDHDWRAAVTDETGPEVAVKGVAEDVKGKAKEAVGAVIGERITQIRRPCPAGQGGRRARGRGQGGRG